MALNIFLFLGMFMNTILECCYLFFKLRNRPSIKYVRNWGNGGGLIQNVYRCLRREGS